MFALRVSRKLRKVVNAKIILADYFLTHLLFTDFYFNSYVCSSSCMISGNYNFTVVLFHKTADVSKQILLENLVSSCKATAAKDSKC